MKGLRAGAMVLVATGLAALVAACGGGTASTETTTQGGTASQPTGTGVSGETAGGGGQAGGTYRVQWEASFNFTNNFDPTGEYLGEAWGVYSSLLVRTLVGYRHVAGDKGNELIPDLATDLGQVSDDGKTYTFHLKDGVKFGPPLDREITSQDVKYAFQRIGTANLVAQYAGYYLPTIVGMQAFFDGKAQDISGIETPDDKTIVFHLTEPTGDFLYRLGMPATGPIPKEVAGCFTKPGDYGRFVISSGPYMLEGSDKLDVTSCDTMQAISGYQPDEHMTLVRNPDYDPATDTPDARENLVDRFEFTINSNNDDIYNKVEAGEVDDEIATETPKVLEQYSKDEQLKPRLHENAGDRTWYITMNLTQPPFDDIHVRKAVNLVLDKQALRLAWGGPTSGDIATHIVPDSIFNGELDGYDPYATPDHRGDVEAAKAEMRQSKYDTDKDGLCDASVCKEVLDIMGDTASRVGMIPIMEDGLRKIGIELKSRSLADSYTIIQTTAKNVPISGQPGWGKDYADAFTFFYYLFNSRTLISTGNSNYSLVGLTPQQAPKLGVKGTIDGVPSVDADLDACGKLAADDRRHCFEDLDKKLMEQVVPWVPYLDATNLDVTGPAVTKWNYDQFSGTIGYAHVAVDPSAQAG